MVRWDLRTDASGQEGLLDELRHRTWTWAAERWPHLQKHWVELALAGTYVIESPAPANNPVERNLEIAFSDPAALDHVRFESFLSDVRRIERDAAELEAEAAAEAARVRAFVAEQHAELLETFDPKVTRLKKRMKILIHHGALNDLSSND